MIIILMIFLLISSVLVMFTKRNKETFYIFGMCISLAILLAGMLLYIAKKGGLSSNLQQFYYFHSNIRTYFQYFLITLDQLGYIVAVGQFLFPLFLLLLALHYSMTPWLDRNKWVYGAIFFFPLASLILYYPTLFHLLPEKEIFLGELSRLWTVSSIIISVCLLFYEAYAIQIRFIRQRFIVIILFILSLTSLYLLYFGQRPDKIYDFYIEGNSFYYVRASMSVSMYIWIVTLNVILSITGFISLLKYTKELFDHHKNEIIIQQKFNSISTGTAVFVHSFKNQLLSNRVIHKQLNRHMQNGWDADELEILVDKLYEQNEKMLERIEELYRSIKTNQIQLAHTEVTKVIDQALESFYDKYPYYRIQVKVDNQSILADQYRLSEAVFNLLNNAQEAVNMLDRDHCSGVSLHCFRTRKYTVIKIQDTGIGINKKEMKKIFDPFYSNKNSNHNWGMGLYYVRTIVKEHFGVLRYESHRNQGTTFYILLPKLEK